ncbi:MAG TPA: FBP domain-containing protein [Candidatus Saccharimonadales bacterium]|nr:FBP domain-containing protein [Candidatus Saccharimonadales bacterium]
MERFDREQFMQLLQVAGVKARLRRELRLAPEKIDWDSNELLAVGDRTGSQGVIFIELEHRRYVLPYEVAHKTADKTGRAKPITCDFCYTWQRGGNAARVSFVRQSDRHIFNFLCCGDLRCSLHVRDKTPQSRLSRTQLHEDIDVTGRIERLRHKLCQLLELLELEPIVE